MQPLIKNFPIRIPSGRVVLNADLTVPEMSKGVVAFAHGSGSSRHSARNRHVAEILNGYGFATLLADLLTDEEEVVDEATHRLRFDIPMLATRLVDIATWLKDEPSLGHLPIGWFGASTGAGAALIAAARCPRNIMAVVSRGGRPDLAKDFLPLVKAPVLMLVGERDPEVLRLNEQAQKQLMSHSQLKVIPKATHLFAEPGTLDAVAHMAAEWFERYSNKAQSSVTDEENRQARRKRLN